MLVIRHGFSFAGRPALLYFVVLILPVIELAGGFVINGSTFVTEKAMEKKIKIDQGAVNVSLRQHRMIVVEYADDYSVTKETAQDITEAIRELAGKNCKTVLHLPGTFTTHEEGVREYLTEMSYCKGKAAEAIVIRNLQQRIKANFYLRVNRPACPTMLFDSEEEAEKWLKACVPGIVNCQ